MTSEWDAFDTPTRTPAEIDAASRMAETERRAAEAAEALHYTRQELAELKAKETALVDELVHLYGQTDEGHPAKAQDWNIEVNPGERWVWDKDLVSELVGTLGASPAKPVEPPDFVDQTCTINRKKYEQADEAMRRLFAPALTRKPGRAIVKVTPDNPSLYSRKE